MKIEIHHIPSKGCELDFEEPAVQFDALKKLMENKACEFVTPIKSDLKVTPMRDVIQVKGSIHFTVRHECVRCLVKFSQDLRSRFTLNYSKEIPKDLHHSDKAGIELTAQQIGIAYFTGDEIDFSGALQEQAVLALPFKALCRDDCKGLCVQCGRNLNKSACQCSATSEDGPFAVLKKMKLPPE